MKTRFTLLFAFFLFAVTAQSQEQRSVFEKASMAKAADGLPCVELAWKKGAEKTAYYLIERSADGQEFKQVALVFTAEDALFSDYKFRDKTFSASGNTPYYRIVLVSDQKEVSYLPVRKVEP